MVARSSSTTSSSGGDVKLLGAIDKREKERLSFPRGNIIIILYPII